MVFRGHSYLGTNIGGNARVHLGDNVTQVVESEEQKAKAILTWLSPLDPWKKHQVARDALQDGSGWVVRIYFNPLVRLIWIGCLVIAFGGLLSLTDRRLRVGAPRRARRPIVAPAE